MTLTEQLEFQGKVFGIAIVGAILLPIMVFYCSKFCAFGWYKGKRLFDKSYPPTPGENDEYKNST